jgi:hypothetical protein
MPDEQERLRLEYGQATELLRTLTDVRFKLLAFAPTIAGTAVAVLGTHAHPRTLLAVGALGLVATTGIVLYELRNTELYEYALTRVEELETQLGLALFTRRPHHRRDRPLALVYAAVVGAWTYLVAWGALAAAGVADAQAWGGAVGGVVAAAAGMELLGGRLAPVPARHAAGRPPERSGGTAGTM